MKRLLYTSIVLLLLFISFAYQKPILTTSEATKQAVSCLTEPSKAKQLGIFPIKKEQKDLTDVHTRLIQEKEKFQWFTNQRKWEVVLRFNHTQTTVVINAYNGTCQEVYGPLN